MTPRALARWLPALLLAWLCLLPAAPAHGQGEPALRLGLYHPRPRLCLADEPAQRDLRVLRLAYGVSRAPAERLEWPWFYRAWALRDADASATPAATLAVALDTEALWRQPLYRVRGAHPKLPEATSVDTLAPWRAWALARLPGAHPAEAHRLAQLLVPAADADPFFPSRLSGSRLLPFQLGRNGRQPLDLCRDWPAGVTYAPAPASTPQSYTLRNARPDLGAPFLLSAYRERADLWRDYFGGRLDALLLEAADFDEELQRFRASQLGSWGVVSGTQQIVLRFQPALARRLGPEGRLALSLALPRVQLAQVQGPGRFAAPLAYLTPVQPPDALEPASGLAWDSLQARRVWLQQAEARPALTALPELRLAVLAHPTLERLALRIQAQWLRTLNVHVRVDTWPIDQLHRVVTAGEADLSLDVMDLDDGSLQDLWLDSLRTALARQDTTPSRQDTALARQDTAPVRQYGARAPLRGGPAEWEAALRAHVPYLPVVGSIHAVLLRPGAPASLLTRVCPGCVPAESPRRLAPEQQERANPQG